MNQFLSFTELDKVTLLDPYALNGMALMRKYLLKTLDADKLLYWFYRNAKLTPKTSSSYGGGWEGALIGGHTLGHYLTALAQGAKNANTPLSGDCCKADFLSRIEYIIAALKRCQDNAVVAGAKAGFLWGAQMLSEKPERQFDLVEQKGELDILTEAWVPWYTMHKILQGLIDVVTLTGIEPAREVATKLGDWIYNRVMSWSPHVQTRVLSVEYGGMNDALYNLYALTGDEKYAVAAHKFDEEALFERILKGPENCLNGLHANTTLPKIMGALNRYITCHGKIIDGKMINASKYLHVAERFFENVINRHIYITGGFSKDEHFVLDGQLDKTRTNDNCETCITYNMLKLSRTLFALTRDTKYLDYYERTYYNAILSSQNPETGMTTYFQPMASGYFKVYSTPTRNFWCCTGSGMENFTKLNDSVYFQSDNAVYVSLYIGSRYQSEKVAFTLVADLENSDTVKIHVDNGSTLLYLRKPAWSQSFGVTLNGKTAEEKDGFAAVNVCAGDEVIVSLQKILQAQTLPDNPNAVAFCYGPFALSARLGTANMRVTQHGVAVSVPVKANVKTSYPLPADTLDNFIKNISSFLIKDENNCYTLACGDTTLVYTYHFRQYTERYGLYLNFIK